MTQQHDVHSRERERYNNMSEHILPNISMEHDISKCHLNTTHKYMRRHRRRHSTAATSLSLSLSLVWRPPTSAALCLPSKPYTRTQIRHMASGGRRAAVVVALQGRSGGRRVVWGGWFALPSGGLPTRAKKYLSQEKIMVEEKKDGGILCAAKRARGFLRRPGVAFAKAKKTRAARRARKGKAAAMVDDYKKLTSK